LPAAVFEGNCRKAERQIKPGEEMNFITKKSIALISFIIITITGFFLRLQDFGVFLGLVHAIGIYGTIWLGEKLHDRK